MATKPVVKKSNALINAAYTITLAEQRLILLAIARSSENAAEMRNLTVHARDYADQYKVTLNTAYEALQTAATQLFERRFSYQRYTEKGHLRDVVSRWVSRVEYGKAEAVVMLSFSDDLLPLLCDLKEKFTYYALEQIADLTSVHAVRLYELLISWQSTGKTPVIEVAELRQRLGIEPNEYQRMTDFKRWVLHAGIKQINEHTDIEASYTQHKRGRRISGFEFSFKSKATSSTHDAKPKRKVISKAQAEAMAAMGETYPELYKRLSSDYIIRKEA